MPLLPDLLRRALVHAEHEVHQRDASAKTVLVCRQLVQRLRVAHHAYAAVTAHALREQTRHKQQRESWFASLQRVQQQCRQLRLDLAALRLAARSPELPPAAVMAAEQAQRHELQQRQALLQLRQLVREVRASHTEVRRDVLAAAAGTAATWVTARHQMHRMAERCDALERENAQLHDALKRAVLSKVWEPEPHGDMADVTPSSEGADWLFRAEYP